MRRALVTGGSSPIGAAIAKALAADGLAVTLHAHRGTARAEETAAAIVAEGGKAEIASFDIADPAATHRAAETLLATGPFQVLVHNAGIHDDAPLAGMSQQQWQSVIDISLNGFFNIVRPLLLPMIGKRWGRIVAISSVSGLMGNRGQANYAAAKAGLHGAIKSLSLEYASRGITANAVAPGVIATPAIDAVMSKEQIAALVPMKRAGRVEEVADLVAFLASEKAGYISGQIIAINGGMV
jgi:3-oxoacyl-[acyl-carrier protein] reductase